MKNLGLIVLLELVLNADETVIRQLFPEFVSTRVPRRKISWYSGVSTPKVMLVQTSSSYCLTCSLVIDWTLNISTIPTSISNIRSAVSAFVLSQAVGMFKVNITRTSSKLFPISLTKLLYSVFLPENASLSFNPRKASWNILQYYRFVRYTTTL